jgi:hypothetical protein
MMSNGLVVSRNVSHYPNSLVFTINRCPSVRHQKAHSNCDIFGVLSVVEIGTVGIGEERTAEIGTAGIGHVEIGATGIR